MAVLEGTADRFTGAGRGSSAGITDTVGFRIAIASALVLALAGCTAARTSV